MKKLLLTLLFAMITFPAHAEIRKSVAEGIPATNNTIMISTGNQRVGIGTIIPEATLDLVGTFQYTDGNQGSGKFLQSDTDGNASWETIPSGVSLSSTNTWTAPQTVYNDNGISVQPTTDPELTYKVIYDSSLGAPAFISRIGIPNTANLAADILVSTDGVNLAGSIYQFGNWVYQMGRADNTNTLSLLVTPASGITAQATDTTNSGAWSLTTTGHSGVYTPHGFVLGQSGDSPIGANKLSVYGDINSTGTVYAVAFDGDGSGLSGIGVLSATQTWTAQQEIVSQGGLYVYPSAYPNVKLNFGDYLLGSGIFGATVEVPYAYSAKWGFVAKDENAIGGGIFAGLSADASVNSSQLALQSTDADFVYINSKDGAFTPGPQIVMGESGGTGIQLSLREDSYMDTNKGLAIGANTMTAGYGLDVSTPTIFNADLTSTGTVTANAFSGDGSGLSGTVAHTDYANTFTSSQTVDAGMLLTGTLTANKVDMDRLFVSSSSADTDTTLDASCSAGYQVISGGCQGNSTGYWIQNAPASDIAYRCTNSAADSIYAWALCGKID